MSKITWTVFQGSCHDRQWWPGTRSRLSLTSSSPLNIHSFECFGIFGIWLQKVQKTSFFRSIIAPVDTFFQTLPNYSWGRKTVHFCATWRSCSWTRTVFQCCGVGSAGLCCSCVFGKFKPRSTGYGCQLAPTAERPARVWDGREPEQSDGRPDKLPTSSVLRVHSATCVFLQFCFLFEAHTVAITVNWKISSSVK